MSPEDDVRAATIADAARALLRVLAFEGIDIEETRLLKKALDEARPLAWEVTQSDDSIYIAMDEDTLDGYDPPSGTND